MTRIFTKIVEQRSLGFILKQPLIKSSKITTDVELKPTDNELWKKDNSNIYLSRDESAIKHYKHLQLLIFLFSRMTRLAKEQISEFLFFSCSTFKLYVQKNVEKIIDCFLYANLIFQIVALLNKILRRIFW